MIKALLSPLIEQYSFLNIFQYITFRTAYGAMTAFLICVLLTPILIALQKRHNLGESIREDGPSMHKEKQGTPTMGGIVIILSIVIAVVLWMDVSSIYTWIVVFVTLGAGVLGFIDDFLKITQAKKGLQARTKIIGQVIIGLITGIILVMTGNEEITRVYIPFLKDGIC